MKSVFDPIQPVSHPTATATTSPLLPCHARRNLNGLRLRPLSLVTDVVDKPLHFGGFPVNNPSSASLTGTIWLENTSLQVKHI